MAYNPQIPEGWGYQGGYPGSWGGNIYGGQSATAPPIGGTQMPVDATFNYPGQWGQAQNIFNRYGTGQGVDTTPLWGAMKKKTETEREDAIKQVAEQMGMGGNRWSSVALRSGQDVSGRLAQDAALDWAKQAIQAQENARLLAMSAGQNLAGLGQQYAQLPLQVGQTMAGMGSQMANEWQRTQPEYSPWMQYGMGMAQQQPGYYPQMYQPSFSSNMLGLGASMLPWAMNQPKTQQSQGQINPYWQPSNSWTWPQQP